MPTVSVAPPFQFADTQGTVGVPFIIAQQLMLLELQDSMDAMGLGVVPLVGNVEGTGTDTIRVTDYGNVGWSLKMTALTGETDTVAPSPVNIGYETVTTGMYGLAHQETYSQQIYSTNQTTAAISLDRLKQMVPTSFLSTWRGNWATTGAGITTAVGSAATTLSVDDWLDLTTVYTTTLGSRRPTAALAPTPLDQLRRSFRTEPAFAHNSADFRALMGLDQEQIHPNFAGMGIDVAVTDDIVQSGGAYQGFAAAEGGIGWAVAGTGRIRPANTQGAVYIPQFGLFIEEVTEGTRQTVRGYRASAWFGFMLGSTRVFVQRRILSVV